MKRVAVYPGSFDPITNGHVDIIQRISKLFDHIIVLIAQSSQKNSLFSPEERQQMLQESLGHLKNVSIDIFNGLTVDYVKKHDAQVIVRGLRAVVDFEYEMTLASMNRKLAPEIETALVFASPEFYYVSSRGVKEVAVNGGSLEGLVPPNVELKLKERLKDVINQS